MMVLKWFGVVFALLMLSGAAFGQYQPVNIVSDQVVYHPETGLIDFRIEFASTPDLDTMDQFGRRKDEFLYGISFDDSTWWQRFKDYFTLPDKLFLVKPSDTRKDRVLEVMAIDLRNEQNDHIVGVAPFEQSGNIVTFTLPVSVFGQADGIFAYHLYTINYGGSAIDDPKTQTAGRSFSNSPGDLNTDGQFNVLDVRLSLLLALGLNPLAVAHPYVGDVYKDAKLDVKDTLLLLNAFLGKTPEPSLNLKMCREVSPSRFFACSP
jgi:hypothetical protein